MTNKYGIELNEGDYVFLPLQFYDGRIMKIVKTEKIKYYTNEQESFHVWLDQGYDELEKGHRHIRGMSADNPFIKVDKEFGKLFHDKSMILEYKKEPSNGRKWVECKYPFPPFGETEKDKKEKITSSIQN